MSGRSDSDRGSPRAPRTGSGGGGGNPPQRRKEGEEVQIPHCLGEDSEFFRISSTKCKYSFITSLVPGIAGPDSLIHSNWMHVLLCNILISQIGNSWTLDSLHDEICKRGVNGEIITKKILGDFLSSDFYHKHEVLLDPKIETARFRINHQVTKPAEFLSDLSKGGKTSLGSGVITDEHIEDAAVLIASMRRGTVLSSGQGGGESGELLFGDLTSHFKNYFGIDVAAPGKRLKAINARTFIVKYDVDPATCKLTTTESDGVSIHKREGRDKSVWYKFLPNTDSRW